MQHRKRQKEPQENRKDSWLVENLFKYDGIFILWHRMYILTLWCGGSPCTSSSPHYSGILAGMWPCGIIVLVAELFRAESKSQVYAAIHEFLRRNPTVPSTISAFLHHFRTYHSEDWFSNFAPQNTYAMMMDVICAVMPVIQYDKVLRNGLK